MRSALMGMLTFVATLGPTDESPRGQYETLVKEYDTAQKAAGRRLPPQDFAPRFFSLAERHHDDPAAIDALTWIASRCVFGPESEKALGILAREYSRSERLVVYCGRISLYGAPFEPYEELLRTVLKNNPHRDVQAAACVALADYLKMAKEKTESNLIRIALRGEQPVSKDSLSYLNRAKEKGLGEVAAESAALFQRAIDQYADISLENNFPHNVGEFARGQLFELRNLVIGAKSLEIEGNDISGKAMKLSDYRGKVVVLDFGSHRTCGVCRQMYPQLRTLVEDFEGKPFALLGINIADDIKELRELTIKGEITWPLWWDGEGELGPIAARWVIHGMTTFYVLDHKGVIRNKGFFQMDEIRDTVEMLLKEMRP